MFLIIAGSSQDWDNFRVMALLLLNESVRQLKYTKHDDMPTSRKQLRDILRRPRTKKEYNYAKTKVNWYTLNFRANCVLSLIA